MSIGNIKKGPDSRLFDLNRYSYPAFDKKYFEKLSDEYHKELNILTKKIYSQAGAEFNINSPKQMKEVLFEKLNISTLNVSKTKTGFSTASEELEKLKNEIISKK